MGQAVMFEDQLLIRHLNRGSKQALRQIYERYRADLFTIAVSLLGDRDLAEDCLQDVFVRLAEAAGQLQVRSHLKGYLTMAILNKARDRMRRKKRQVDVRIEDMSLSDPMPKPDEQLVDTEQQQRLLVAIEQLPLEQREVFVLHVQGQMTFRQIAQQQAVSVRTAHSRYRYAIEKLRAILKQEDQNETRRDRAVS
jgi:RNA polymerase sigma-70 factor (ECF subfamily)